MFILRRTYLNEATNGELLFDDKHIAYTIELSWKDNQKEISCIPEGEYILRKRYSEKFKWHWVVLNVPNRNFILIHPANDAYKELKGCIAPVFKCIAPGKGTESKRAMQNVLEIFDKHKVNGQVKLLIVSEN